MREEELRTELANWKAKYEETNEQYEETVAKIEEYKQNGCELYRIVPNYVINKYVKDKDILKLVKKLKRNNPLDYRKDFSLKRKYYIIGALINHIRKFRKYYE